MKQAVGILLVAAAFVAAGWFTWSQAAPGPVVGWTLGLLGLGAVVLAFTLRQRIAGSRASAAAPARERASRAALEDGSDYRVDVDDDKFSLTNLRTGEVKALRWSELTAVYIVALAGFPAGDISYVAHRGDYTLEVPLGAAGNEAFLATMQEKLDGFDNAALIEGMAMAQGRRQVWPAESAAER